MKICENPKCKKKLPKGRRKYCSDKCQGKDLYQRKKDVYKITARTWERDNQERDKEIKRKAVEKFRTEKRGRFNKLILDNYYKDKPKWKSRTWTYQIINNLKRKTGIKKECKKCKSKDSVSLKFKVYPNKAKEIRQAIKDKKIYYLCKRCRYEN